MWALHMAFCIVHGHFFFGMPASSSDIGSQMVAKHLQQLSTLYSVDCKNQPSSVFLDFTVVLVFLDVPQIARNLNFFRSNDSYQFHYAFPLVGKSEVKLGGIHIFLPVDLVMTLRGLRRQ